MSLSLTLVVNESGQWTLKSPDELKQVFLTLRDGQKHEVTINRKGQGSENETSRIVVSKNDLISSEAFNQFWKGITELAMDLTVKAELGEIIEGYVANPYYEKESGPDFVVFSLFFSQQQNPPSEGEASIQVGGQSATQYLMQSFRASSTRPFSVNGAALSGSCQTAPIPEDMSLSDSRKNIEQPQGSVVDNKEQEVLITGSIPPEDEFSSGGGSFQQNIYQLAKLAQQGYTSNADDEGGTDDSIGLSLTQTVTPFPVSPLETISSINQSYISRFTSKPVLSVADVVNDFESYDLGEKPILFLDMDEVFLTDVTKSYTKDMSEKQFSLVHMESPEELKSSIDEFMARYPEGKVVLLTNSTEIIAEQELAAVNIKKEWFYAVLTKKAENIFKTKGERADDLLNAEATEGKVYSGACLADDTQKNREEFEESMIKRGMKVKVVPVVGAVNEKLHIVALQEVKAGKYADVQDAEEAIKEQPEFVGAFKAYNTLIAELDTHNTARSF
ncbi:hypothetical protein SOPP22_02215 [Shewanella sp. OPT22]|nr:hypothetical protein SOPP22_02215 [Shewanella sp. OPT22]